MATLPSKAGGLIFKTKTRARDPDLFTLCELCLQYFPQQIFRFHSYAVAVTFLCHTKVAWRSSGWMVSVCRDLILESLASGSLKTFPHYVGDEHYGSGIAFLS